MEMKNMSRAELVSFKAMAFGAALFSLGVVCGCAAAPAGVAEPPIPSEPSMASGIDYYADPVIGNDSYDGRSPDRAFKTLDHASRVLKAGDTLHLKAGCVFRESLHFRSSGTSAKPIRVKGNGAVLSGLEPVPDDSWRDQGDGLWLSTNKMFWGACRPRVLLPDGTMVSVEVGNPAFKDPKSLKVGQAAWNSRGIWFRCAPGERPQDYRLSGYYRVSGVEVVNRHNWIVENLIVEHFTNDGINVHGLCRGLYFFDIVARQNGDDGFSIHENVYASVRNLHVWGNDFGISDISQSQSVFSGVVAESNRICGVDFHGGIRILRDATVRDNLGNQIAISSEVRGKNASNPNPMLRGTVLLEDVRVEGGEGAGVIVKPGCTVSIVNSRISGVQTGLKLEGGRVHLENSKVERCTQMMEKAPGCEFTCAETR